MESDLFPTQIPSSRLWPSIIVLIIVDVAFFPPESFSFFAFLHFRSESQTPPSSLDVHPEERGLAGFRRDLLRHRRRGTFPLFYDGVIRHHNAISVSFRFGERVVGYNSCRYYNSLRNRQFLAPIQRVIFCWRECRTEKFLISESISPLR